MNDEILDELVALYHQNAREVAPGRLNARVLMATEHVARKRRFRLVWPWLGLAMAASVFICLTLYRATPPPAPVPSNRLTQNYLLHMDVEPSGSPVTAYLLSNNERAYALLAAANTKETP
ncbi:hypothetical protein [Dyella acidisoli]|uniref:Uncharacterized protein n=1 Tax=Dyella acidisoli TaxID=1867834 RepID=A0ABQ5XJK5_9GAMM|nr:hypothetical protein [Dyella acidisoli]GLQ91142.1 hypothetical protein GCM10007901_00920 [Dyella acidisoli]